MIIAYTRLPYANSFAGEAGIPALQQLGDILQSPPEVYMSLILYGGDEIRARILSLFKSLEAISSYPGFFMKIRSLLTCHVTGLKLVSNCIQEDNALWDPQAQLFINQSCPSDVRDVIQAREILIPLLL